MVTRVVTCAVPPTLSRGGCALALTARSRVVVAGARHVPPVNGLHSLNPHALAHALPYVSLFASTVQQGECLRALFLSREGGEGLRRWEWDAAPVIAGRVGGSGDVRGGCSPLARPSS